MQTKSTMTIVGVLALLAGLGLWARPAAAVAPREQSSSESGWDLNARAFSAVQVVTDTKRKEQHRMKMYARPQMFRMDMDEKGEQMSMIMRFDRDVMWTVMPKQKSYMELSLKLGKSFSDRLRDPKAKVEREDLGRERVGQYNCTKYRVRVTSEGETYTGIIWAAQELNGFPVKMTDEKGEAVVEFQDIQLTAPELSLFEPPAGYQKMVMPSLGDVLGGQKETEPKQENKPRFPLRLPKIP